MTGFVKDKSFYRSILAIAIPMTMQSILAIGVNALDSVMLGSFGEVEMSAVAQAGQIFFLYSLLMIGFIIGGSILISQYWGKGDMKSIRTVLSITLRFSMALTAVLCTAFIAFPEFFISIYSKDPRVIAQGAEYLRIAAFSYPLYAVSYTFLLAFRGTEQAKVVLYINGISYSVNMLLNYIFIFGKFGAPALGVKGAAVGTVIARAAELLFVLSYLKFKEKHIHFRISDLKLYNPLLLKDYVKSMMPVMGHEIVWGVGMTSAAFIMGRLSTDAVAAYNIAYTLFHLISSVCIGLSNASLVLTGKVVGSGKRDLVKQNTYTFLLLALGIGTFSAVLTMALKDVVLSLYNVAPQTKELAGLMIVVMAVVGFLYAFETVTLVGILRGGGDAKTGLYTDLVVMWVIAVPLALLGAFVLGWPAFLVIVTLKIDMPLKAAVGVIRTLRMKWVKNVTRDFEEA